MVKVTNDTLRSCAEIAKEYDLNVSSWTLQCVFKCNSDIARQKVMSARIPLKRHKLAAFEYAGEKMNRSWNNRIS